MNEELEPIEGMEDIFEQIDKAVENKQEVIKEQAVEDPIVVEAKSKGWRPEGEKSAAEFLRAEPLYEEIKARGKEIEELTAAMKHMRSIMDKQEQKAYEKAIKDLQEAKREAIELGDVDEVSRIDREAQTIQKPISPKVDEFIKANESWLKGTSAEDRDKQLFAEAKYMYLKNQGKTDDEIVDEVSVALNRLYPKNEVVKEVVPKVSPGATAAVAGNSGRTVRELTKEQKEFGRFYEQNGIMTMKEYIAELEKSGELK